MTANDFDFKHECINATASPEELRMLSVHLAVKQDVRDILDKFSYQPLTDDVIESMRLNLLDDLCVLRNFVLTDTPCGFKICYGPSKKLDDYKVLMVRFSRNRRKHTVR